MRPEPGERLVPVTMEADGRPKIGRYELFYRIGSGGMGAVYLATAHDVGGLDRWVAIKRMHGYLAAMPQFEHMLLDEARLAGRIGHPNVAQVFEVGEEDGSPFVVMEYLHGEPLSMVIRRSVEVDGAPPCDLMARIVAWACEGAHAAHELKGPDGAPLHLVHRDLSPHNVFVTYDGAVKVVDFGCAKAKGRSTLTEPGTIKGKFSYMSPEQADGEEVDRRSDVFALGAVLYKATTGQTAFEGVEHFSVLSRVHRGEYDPPSLVDPDFPPELEAIVRRALSVAKKDRYPTARELGEALDRYLADRRIVAGASQISGLMRRLFPARLREREAILRRAPGETTGETTGPQSDVTTDPDDTHVGAFGAVGSEVHTTQETVPPVDPYTATEVLEATGTPVTAPRERPLPRRELAAVAVAMVLGLTGVWLLGSAFEPRTELRAVPLASAIAPRPGAELSAPPGGAPGMPEPVAAPVVRPVAVSDGARLAGPPERPPLPEPVPAAPVGERRVRPERPRPPAASPASTENGLLNVTSDPWAEVSVDGRPLRRTPIVGLSIAAGSHSVRLVAEDGRTRTRRVVVTPSRETLVHVRF